MLNASFFNKEGGFIMRRHSLPTGIFAIACSLLANATGAQAAAETWVAATGSDSGNCPVTTPCKTFQFAHGQTDSGGAINVLSSGNFGPVTITKSISIVADGVEAVINGASGGAGIVVKGVDIVVSLRGLTIDLSGNNNGISFGAGSALHVRNCSIRRANKGILFTPSSGTSELYIADSVVANTSLTGIHVLPAESAIVKAMVDHVRVENVQGGGGMVFSGISTTGSVTATVRDSVSSGHFGSGILAVESGSGTTNVMIDRSAFANSAFGLTANGAGATIRVGDSTISGNGVGLSATVGGVMTSYGTNKVDGNGLNGAPTGLPIAMK
jgi:hypothetical protein